MDHLPLSDIPMLVSSINFLLRDEEFENLDQIRDQCRNDGLFGTSMVTKSPFCGQIVQVIGR